MTGRCPARIDSESWSPWWRSCSPYTPIFRGRWISESGGERALVRTFGILFLPISLLRTERMGTVVSRREAVDEKGGIDSPLSQDQRRRQPTRQSPRINHAWSLKREIQLPLPVLLLPGREPRSLIDLAKVSCRPLPMSRVLVLRDARWEMADRRSRFCT